MNFLDRVSKNLNVNFIKIRPVGVELYHADGRTDMKLTAAFRNFAKKTNNKSVYNSSLVECSVNVKIYSLFSHFRSSFLEGELNGTVRINLIKLYTLVNK